MLARDWALAQLGKIGVTRKFAQRAKIVKVVVKPKSQGKCRVVFCYDNNSAYYRQFPKKVDLATVPDDGFMVELK